MGSPRTDFQRHLRRGDFPAAYAYAATLPAVTRAGWAFALAYYRGRLSQGDLVAAEAALAGIDRAELTSVRRLILAMERAQVRGLREADFPAALAAATEAWEQARDVAIPSAERAEAERVYIRLQLIAATYFVLPRTEARAALDRLPELADPLRAAGREDEALAAETTVLKQQTELPARETVAELAERARAAGRSDLAGDVWMDYAQAIKKQHHYAAATVIAALDRAEEAYRACGHRYGTQDVTGQRTLLDPELDAAGKIAILDRVRRHFEQATHYRGMTSVLMDLSQLAHQSGDLALAARYRADLLAWSDRLGLRIMIDSFLTAQVDLLLRNADYGEAIELCRRALRRVTSPMNAALYEQLLASAYAFLDDYPAAEHHGARALRQFTAIGAEDAASDCALKHAADLMGQRTDAGWRKADDLLLRWLEKDRRRGDTEAVVAKLELRAQLLINRFLFSPTAGGDVALLRQGEQLIAEAEQSARSLVEPTASQRLANLAQLRGQYLQSRGDEAGVIAAWQTAQDHFQRIGYAMEVANCEYILGIIHLNRANRELQPNFGIAEQRLLRALDYYTTAGMRNQAVDTSFMLAKLYANGALRVDESLGARLLDAALDRLATAAATAEEVRMAYGAGRSVLDVHQGKQALGKNRLRVDQLALEITCTIRPDAAGAWAWTQRSKARALADLLGAGTAIPAELRRDARLRARLEREQELIDRLDRAEDRDRPQRHEALQAWRRTMRAEPKLASYLNLRQGAAPSQAAVQAHLAAESRKLPNRLVYVDWVAVGEQLFLSVLTAEADPRLFPLSISLSEVNTFVREELSRARFRNNLRFIPNIFERFDALVAPIASATDPEDLLVLCPTGLLHRLPLHALRVEEQLLIERNPVVYTASSAVWRYGLTHPDSAGTTQPTAALFGNPRGDRPTANKIIRTLADRFDAETFLETSVTREAFLAAAPGKDLLHFQGHALHDISRPLDSYLELADGPLSARDIFETLTLQADLVSLAACETATAAIAPGDEPLGLVPAFQYAGGRSVLATLWKVQEEAAARCMRSFFAKLPEQMSRWNKAQALRDTILELKHTPRFNRPYYWAPFVLFGNWR